MAACGSTAMEVRNGEPWPNRRGRSLFTSRDGRQAAREDTQRRRPSASVVRPVDPQPLRATGEGTARRPRVRSVPSDDRCVVVACRGEAPDSPPVISGLSVCARRVERLSLCGAAQSERVGRRAGRTRRLSRRDPGSRDRCHPRPRELRIAGFPLSISADRPASAHQRGTALRRGRYSRRPARRQRASGVVGASLSPQRRRRSGLCVSRCRMTWCTGRSVAMRNLRLASWGLLIPMLLNANTVSAQLLQGIPRSPIETMGGSVDRVPEGWYVMPWVAAGVVYDDNVFFAPRNQRQEDVFLRVTPGLQGSYQSTPVTVIGNYRFDSEVYNKLTSLNSAQQQIG